MIKEKLKDIGRSLRGEGLEVKFKNEVAQYEATHGVSHEAAEKALFTERFNAIQHELLYTRNITEGTYRAFVASLNEVFGKDGVADMRRDAADPMIYRALALPPVSPAEFNQTASYFKTKFENRVPNAAVVRDCAESKKIIDALHARFMGDPALAAAGDLETLIRAHRKLGADLGKVLSAKELADMHERKFERKVHFDGSAEAFKATAKESLGTMLWKAPSEWWKVVGKSGQKLDLAYCAKTTIATAELLHKEGKAGTKILLEAAKTAKAYLDTKRA